MRFRPLLTAVLGISLTAASTSSALSQARPDIFVTPVADAPFSGVVQVTRSIVQPNGTVAQLKTIREIGRDTEGRIHNEMRALVPVSTTVEPPLIRVHIYDPLYRTNYFLDSNSRTYSTSIVSHPPRTEPPDLLAAPAGKDLPASQFAGREDLGTKEMDGVSVHGVRTTQAVTMNSDGTGKQVIVADEYWYSSDLRMNLMVRHDDPRTGSVTLTVTQIKRGNPAASLFEVPSDYAVAQPGRGVQEP